MKKWVRFRFQANYDDSRPVLWPPLGPWWETGLACDGSYATVVAYIPSDKIHLLATYWPEAKDISCQETDEIVFTSRFPKPDWWTGEGLEMREGEASESKEEPRGRD